MSDDQAPRDDAAARAILREFLRCVDLGVRPDVDGLVREHPGHRGYIRALLAELDSSTLSPGHRLLDFEIEREIGRGGMGVVYRARQLSLGGRPVAVKVLHGVLSPQQVARLRREALSLANLHNPHLCEVYGFGEVDRVPFFAMRLIEGVALGEVRKRVGARSRGDVRRAVRIGEQVATALCVVHDAGQVHRDVKPQNVMLEEVSESSGLIPDGRAVLVDFGLVRSREEWDIPSRSGTDGYSPPEVAEGATIGPDGDVFALGATLHDLLTGVDGSERLSRGGVGDLRALCPAVDADLAAVIVKAAAPDREDRYRDAAALRRDLRAWLIGAPVAARPLGPLARVRRWTAAHPDVVLRRGFVAAAIAVSIAVIAYAAIALHSAGQIERAFEEQRLADVARLVADAPPAPIDLLVRDLRLAAAVRALRDGATDSLADVCRLARQGDRPAAVWAAVDALHDGREAHPVLGRFLADAMSADNPSRAATQNQLAALTAVCQLLAHEPPRGADLRQVKRPIRDRADALWRDPAAVPESRLLALAILSWCAEPELARDTLRAAMGAPPFTEEARLSMVATAELLRRGHLAGALDADLLVELDRLMCEHLESLPRRWAGHVDDADVWQVGKASVQVSVRVSRGLRALDIAPTTPRSPELFARCLEVPTHWPLLALAVARGPSLVAMVEDALRGEIARDGLEPWCLGLAAAGMLPLDASLPAHLAAVPEIAEGFAYGRAESDPTGLVTDIDPDSWPELDAASAPATIDLEETVPSVPRVIAAWDFMHGGRHGFARGATAIGCQQHDAPDGFMRMAQAGTSEVFLPFDLPGEPQILQGDRMSVRVRGLAPKRDGMPRYGTAEIEVAVDRLVVGSVALPTSGSVDIYPPVHPLCLPPGSHELSIRLTEASTTQLRLHSVRLLKE